MPAEFFHFPFSGNLKTAKLIKVHFLLFSSCRGRDRKHSGLERWLSCAYWLYSYHYYLGYAWARLLWPLVPWPEPCPLSLGIRAQSSFWTYPLCWSRYKSISFLLTFFHKIFFASSLFQGILDNYKNYKGAAATFLVQDSARQNVSRLSLLNQQADRLQRCLIGVAWTENASWKTN